MLILIIHHPDEMKVDECCAERSMLGTFHRVAGLGPRLLTQLCI